MSSRTVLPLLWVLFFLTIGYVAFQFSYLDQVTSFADDGGSYLIMAKHFSPYSVAPPLIEQAYLSEQYPPLYPILLAYAGGAEDIAQAHLVNILLFVFGTALLALWAARLLNSHWLSLLACLVYVSSPGVWPMLLRIVSEELYIVLTFGVFLVARKAKSESGIWLVVLTLLLTAVVLTRSTGVTLIIAWGLYLLFSRSGERPSGWASTISLAVPVLAVLLWHITRQSGIEDLYGSELEVLLNRFSNSQALYTDLAGYLITQSEAFIESWLGALMLMWQPGVNIRTFASLFLMVLVIGGWLLRIRNNCLDAWYVLFYVGMIIAWPFPGQFYRFILPLFPIFVVYALLSAQGIASRNTMSISRIFPLVTAMVFLSLTVPALGLIYQRAHYTAHNGPDLSSYPEFYQEANFNHSRDKALQHHLVLEDLEWVKQYTSEKDTIMWFTPNYINLLAERSGMAFPGVAGKEAMLSVIARNPPNYIYISSLHPRRTTDDGLAMLSWVGDAGSVIKKRYMPGTSDMFSVLLHIENRERLQ